MALEIPTNSVNADYIQSVPLDGSTYLFSLSWSERSESWYLDLALQTDGDPVPIVEGARLSPGYPLLVGVVVDGRPPGELACLDLNEQGTPLRNDLGNRVKLYYFDQEELSG